MHVASFESDGHGTYGVVIDDFVHAVNPSLSGKFPTLVSLLAAGALDRLQSEIDAAGRPLADVRMLPVIPEPRKIFCIGINYASHLAETGREPPAYPMLFTRFADSQVGHQQPMIRPLDSEKFDFEGELAVIIGRGGRRIEKSVALEHVAGYACYNDGSIRDWQRHTSQFIPGKNFPGTGAFGPWMTTSDVIPRPQDLQLTTRLNGIVMQEAPVSDLVFDVPSLIAYCSTFTELSPGDVIVTGTTGGVGAFRNPPVWMRKGDIVEVEISLIGTLRNPVASEG